jgi:hypothetical protein
MEMQVMLGAPTALAQQNVARSAGCAADQALNLETKVVRAWGPG